MHLTAVWAEETRFAFQHTPKRQPPYLPCTFRRATARDQRAQRVRGRWQAHGGDRGLCHCARRTPARLGLYERRRSRPPPLDVSRVGLVGLGRHVFADARAVAAAVDGADTDADDPADVYTHLHADASAERGADARPITDPVGSADARANPGADLCADPRADGRSDPSSYVRVNPAANRRADPRSNTIVGAGYFPIRVSFSNEFDLLRHQRRRIKRSCFWRRLRYGGLCK